MDDKTRSDIYEKMDRDKIAMPIIALTMMSTATVLNMLFVMGIIRNI